MILHLSFLESRLINLDFFIKKVSFCTSSDELSSQNVSFAYNQLILFLKFLLLIFNLIDDCLKFILFHKKVLDFVFFFNNIFLKFLNFLFFIFNFLVFLIMFSMLLD